MGLQLRRRTKGKTGWFNFSGSGMSFSFKPFSFMTLNSRGRSTINLGGGLRYVGYAKKKKNEKRGFIKSMFGLIKFLAICFAVSYVIIQLLPYMEAMK